MKKILIFGGAGFVGSNLAFYFKKKGDIVTVFDNLVRRGSENNLSIFKKMGIKFIHGDIRNTEDFIKLEPNTFDIVLECAAQPSAINYANPKFDITNNTIGLLNVVEYVRKTKSRLIFWSTNKVFSGKKCNSFSYKIEGKRFVWNTQLFYSLPIGWSQNGFSEDFPIDGNDRSIYGLSKAMSDILIQEMSDAYKIPSIINRFSCLAGPNQWGIADQGWVAWFAIANELGLPLEIFGYEGMQVRDYLFIDDVCNLINKQSDALLDSKNKMFGEVFNVGGGKDYSISINEAVDYIKSINKPWKNIKYNKEQRRADQAIYITDFTKAQNTFNWKPKIDYIAGYKQIFSWIEKNKPILKDMYC